MSTTATVLGKTSCRGHGRMVRRRRSPRRSGRPRSTLGAHLALMHAFPRRMVPFCLVAFQQRLSQVEASSSSRRAQTTGRAIGRSRKVALRAPFPFVPTSSRRREGRHRLARCTRSASRPAQSSLFVSALRSCLATATLRSTRTTLASRRLAHPHSRVGEPPAICHLGWGGRDNRPDH